MLDAADVVVVGAGIAGASVGAVLASRGVDVVVVEAEDGPGRHTTGRSAAVFTENYGNPVVRRLTMASRAFLSSPPDGFADVPLLTPRGALWVAGPDQVGVLQALAAGSRRLVPSVVELDTAGARSLCPALSPAAVVAALHEPDAMDIDVDALLQGSLRALRRAGGRVVVGARVVAASRPPSPGGRWTVTTTAGDVGAATVVNAAGAWADEVATTFGARPVGLRPLRRTAFLFDPPDGSDARRWPLVIDAEERCYCRPEGGRLMGSPADETLSPPVDARPEEVDVALGLERLGVLFGRALTHAARPWAGLRTFAPDRTPVVGPDPAVEGFLWLAGQGGYGIQTAPAMAAAAAGYVVDGALPASLVALGVTDDELRPSRFVDQAPA